jgi:trimethylamine--corrinoid protein Co-methyltransferase
MIKTIRPKLGLLSRRFIEKIIAEAYEILDKQGIFVENRNALKLFEQAGMKVDKKSQRVHIKRRLVEKCLATAPSVVHLYDRAGKREYTVGGDEVHFDPGSAAVTILDHKTGEERKPDTADLVRFYRLTECLENIHFQSTGLISSDVPHPIADIYRLYLGLMYSNKPVVTGTFRVESFRPMKDLLVAVRGSQKELARKPLAIFDACPSPPLKWSNLTTQSLIDSARAGIPSELIAMGMTGATSLVTIAGNLVQHVAENLCGVAIVQLAKPGAPVIFGGSPSSFDMRRGTTPMGAIETMMIDAGYAQIGKYLNLPTHAYMGLSDAKTNDAQAGLETGLGAVLGALAGVNVISGPGMLDFESCQSLEKLVIDDEICGMAYRLIAGIAQREDPIAADKYVDFTPDTQFLTMPHTKKWYRMEHSYPVIADRDTYDAWVASGRKPIAERASEQVEKILRSNPPALAEEDVRSGLTKIMRAFAKANEIDTLPEPGF